MSELELINRMLIAIAGQNWGQFKELESEFVSDYDIGTWEDAFNFQLLPKLTDESKKWLLIQKCSLGIKSIKILAN